MPSMELTLMMRAGRAGEAASRKTGRNARVVANAAVRLTATTFWNISIEKWSKGTLKLVPALLTSTSQRAPIALSTRSSSLGRDMSA
eukprot:scaffold861_cov33-Tisochrysis_lutea.AAC.1